MYPDGLPAFQCGLTSLFAEHKPSGSWSDLVSSCTYCGVEIVIAETPMRHPLNDGWPEWGMFWVKRTVLREWP